MMKEFSLEIFSPAKVNLFLAVMGERGDGFHNILSLVAKVKFGDSLKMALVEGMDDGIECDVEEVPIGEENLIMRVISEVRRRYCFGGGVRVRLEKKIPMGAGFGGGSSNGVTALKGLNRLLGEVLNKEEMREIAIRLGSDCALFLEEGLMIVRGRGEKIERVEKALEERINGQKIIIFKPEYSINTGWAYEEMKKNPEYYLIKKDAEMGLSVGLGRILRGEGLELLVYNNFERIVFRKYPELKRVMAILYEEYNVNGLLSGSGSGCFCLLKRDSDREEIKKRIKEVLGKNIFIVETEIV